LLAAAYCTSLSLRLGEKEKNASVNDSKACYKHVKHHVLLKNALYINQHSMLAQLGVFLKNALYISIVWQITPYTNLETFEPFGQTEKIKQI
jgi:hypothetical protein